ncbi:MAG: hypothetical protein ORN56_04715 [Chitinophagales bacterium]|nr:hypothetical protein [Chitinophagales bacterium]
MNLVNSIKHQYFPCLLLSFLFSSLPLLAQSSRPYSIFGSLSALELNTAPISPKQLRGSLMGSKTAYLPKGGLTQAQLQTHIWSIHMQQQAWDHTLKQTSLHLLTYLYPTKNLVLTPTICFEQMKVAESQLPVRMKGELTLRYQLSQNWRLASAITFDQKQTEINQVTWIAGILFAPNPLFQLEFNIRRNEFQNNLNSTLLLQWQAHKKLNLCLGRCTNGELLWNTVWSYKELKIATLTKFHPILGTTFAIALSGPLLLRTNR